MKKLILFLCLAASASAFGTTKTSVLTGSWNNPNIWSPAGVPTASDDTVIVTTMVLFNFQNVSCTSSYLEVVNGAQLFAGIAGNSFTFTGDVFINNGTMAGEILSINTADSAVNNNGMFFKYVSHTGLFVNRSSICVQFDFTSADSLVNNAEVSCGSWINSAGVTGNPGQFCVASNFVNSGSLSGNLDICDATPSGAGDSNTGTISGSVTNCMLGPCPLCSSLGYEEHAMRSAITIAPSPVSTIAVVTLELDGLDPNAPLTFTIIDVQGRVVKTIPFTGTTLTFDRNGIESGLYFYSVIMQDGAVVAGKLMID